jgi:hypothetical protein
MSPQPVPQMQVPMNPWPQQQQQQPMYHPQAIQPQYDPNQSMYGAQSNPYAPNPGYYNQQPTPTPTPAGNFNPC